MSRQAGDVEARARNAEDMILSATSQKAALEAAINATELYMNALSLADTPALKKRLDAKCRQLLTIAEQIKENRTRPHKPLPSTDITGAAGARPEEPVSTRPLSKREQIILLEGSKLNCFIFPPWSGPPNPREFDLQGDEQLFKETTEIRLSDTQREIFSGWKRPSELVGPAHDLSRCLQCDETIELAQDVITDCSVVASLCACASRRGKTEHKLSLIRFFPNDGVVPRPSKSGKYILCLYFNGCFRKIVIDDLLPSSSTGRYLYTVDKNDSNRLLPALIEKAYLKVRGGYDFPGSNSGTDLWTLTGWIPEQIFLHSDDVSPDELWRRVFGAFNYGDVLLTVGTGALTEQEEKELGLVSSHDYAILDMKENNGRREFLVKNPWASGMHRRRTVQGTKHNLLSAEKFWIDCDKIFPNFENMYLNWNPTLFAHREDIHFTWDTSLEKHSPSFFAGNPQFSISSEKGGPVWLLLSRHFKTGDYEHIDGKGSIEPGYISIYVFTKTRGNGVFLSRDSWRHGPYVDSPNTLMRFEMPPKTTYTVIAAEQSLPRTSHNFSLSGFSTGPIHVAPAMNKFIYQKQLHASWTKDTAGGNTDSARYDSNPQFVVQVTEPSDFAILLDCDHPEFAIHVKLVWSSGKRVSVIKTRDIITDSGDYERGCALAKASNVGPGAYTIVCSTFAPDQIGSFTLRIYTTKPCNARILPQEGAGRLRINPEIGIFPPGMDRIITPLGVTRLTRLKIIARNKGSKTGTRAAPPSPILMSVEHGKGPYRRILAVSGDGSYDDTVTGVRIEDIDLQPGYENTGGLWLVVQRIGGPSGQVEDRIEVEILAEERVEVGQWTISDVEL